MYVLPALMIAATFALKPLRAWLENRARESVNQAELLVSYQDNVSRFLRLSDAEKHAELRQIVVWVGHHMLDGTRLIRRLLLRGRRRSETDAEIHAAVDDAFADLPDEAVHAFGKAIGAALLMSSYQAVFLGSQYRSMLLWLLNSPDREVKEPEQIIYRFRKSNELDDFGAQRIA